MKQVPDWFKPLQQTAFFRALHFFCFPRFCHPRKLMGMMLLLLLTGFSPSFGQPTIQWDNTIGGDLEDGLADLQQTSDGGYILGGTSVSPISGDKTSDSRGGDYWVVKLDAAGNKQWDRTYGGSAGESLASIRQTLDGGYILGGYSGSPISGDKTEDSRGEVDFWVVKLDADGNKVWDKTLGGSETDILTSIQQIQDGGYILGGYSNSPSSGDKTESSRGMFDFWVAKLNTEGSKVWDRTYGGSETDISTSLQRTPEGGYILGGYSNSPISGDKTEENQGETDFWLVKLDVAGSKIWDKTFGNAGQDFLNALQPTGDGGYLLGGASGAELIFDADFRVIKIDAAGNREWDQTFGGGESDRLISLQQTRDGGYVLGGSSESNAGGDKTENSRGGTDHWLVKLDAAGNKVWDKTIGGNGEDNLAAIQQTADGGYVLGGTSGSGIGGDKTGASRGSDDYWVVKLAPFLDARQVVSFTLINTESEQPIRTLQDGDELDLAALPKKLSIRADADPATVGSVRFELSGQQTRTFLDNIAPYALFGDIRGDYEKWDPFPGPAPGSYTLIATPYARANAQGEVGIALTIHFTVKPPRVESFTLINTESEQPIRTLQDWDELDLAALPKKLSIRADTDVATVGSVRFELIGQQGWTYEDNSAPYALFGDVRGDYEKWDPFPGPAPGSYTLIATPFSEANGQGEPGNALLIHFTVINKAAARLAQASQAIGPEWAPRLTLYPNPTDDGRLQVQLSNQVLGRVRYSLLSSVGARLAEGTLDLDHAANLLELDFSRQIQAPGLYYLQLEATGLQQVFKIMRR